MFSYIGGKYRQAKWISEFIPDDIETYAEVFGGAMWTYVNGKVNADNIHYNDFNTQMANLLYCCSEYEKFIPFLDSRKAQIGAEEFNSCKSDVLDVINIIASIVVAGNIRRSAILLIGDANDKEYLNAKRWDLGNISEFIGKDAAIVWK